MILTKVSLLLFLSPLFPMTRTTTSHGTTGFRSSRWSKVRLWLPPQHQTYLIRIVLVILRRLIQGLFLPPLSKLLIFRWKLHMPPRASISVLIVSQLSMTRGSVLLLEVVDTVREVNLGMVEEKGGKVKGRAGIRP